MKKFFKGLKGSYLALILLFLYSPIAIMITFSFNAGKSRSKWEGFSFKWYQELFKNEAIMEALRVTLTVAVIATVVSVILGTLGAIAMPLYAATIRLMSLSRSSRMLVRALKWSFKIT